MDKISLSAQKRTILGRKIKKLRREGFLPANIYGKKVKSLAVTVPFSDFEKVYKKAGETGLVDLTIDKEVRPVLIQNVQYNPVDSKVLHADFYQVDLKEKVTARGPVELVGAAKAVTDKVGVLLTLLDEVEVEALPRDLPEKLMVNVDELAVVDQVIKVSDLKVDAKVKILTPTEREVVKVAPLVSKEAEKQAQEEEAAKAAAAAAATEAGAAAAPPGGGEQAAPSGSGAVSEDQKKTAAPPGGKAAGTSKEEASK